MGDVSSIGRKDRSAIAGVRRTGSADDRIHIMAFGTGSGEAGPGRWLHGDAGLRRELQRRLSERPIGTTGALIFEHVRARLPAQSAAMAASKASRSTQ